jgi:membrane protein YdbS with pleckstrin-like domain
MTNHKTSNDNDIWKLRSFPSKITHDEDIILITREDVVVLFGKGLVLFGVFFIFLIIKLFISLNMNEIFVNFFDTLFYGINCVLLLVFTWIFHKHYLSIQVVTNERIIDIDQTGIFVREVNELPLSGIEDVSVKQTGIFSTMFNFGNVILQTAGTGQANGVEDKINGFVFNNVPSPQETSTQISRLFQKEQKQDFEQAAKANAKAMKEMFDQQSSF